MTEPVERDGRLRLRPIAHSHDRCAKHRLVVPLPGVPAPYRLAVRRRRLLPACREIVATEGERSTWRRQADSGAWLAFHFCPKCGSTVFWENERLPDIVSVAVGAFADPHFPPPVRTVWTRTKHDWLGFPEHPPAIRRVRGRWFRARPSSWERAHSVASLCIKDA